MLALLALLALVQDSTPAAAAADSVRFHRGQWAAQFTGGLNFGSLGALKFRSVASALLLDLRVTGAHGEDSFTDSSGTHFAELISRAIVSLRFGWRNYQDRHSKVVPHYSLGILAGFSHLVTRGAFPRQGTKDESWQAGAFADVGATYLLTPQFGIGALAGANLTYEWGDRRSSLSPRTHYWTLSGAASTPTFLVTLFF